MSGSDSLREELLALVPDAPVWIEARAALLEQDSRMYGDRHGYVIRSDRLRLAAIGGQAQPDLIRDALGDIEVAAGGEASTGVWAVVTPEGPSEAASEALGDWATITAVVFREPDEGIGPDSLDGTVRLSTLTGSWAPFGAGLPETLADEVRRASERTELAVAWIDGNPVSFCYAACETRTLWDVSIDTVEEYRRRGLAGATVRYLARRMRARGKSAVWGAHTGNLASSRLAGKLGFRHAGRLHLFETRPKPTRGLPKRVESIGN